MCACMFIRVRAVHSLGRACNCFVLNSVVTGAHADLCVHIGVVINVLQFLLSAPKFVEQHQHLLCTSIHYNQ